MTELTNEATAQAVAEIVALEIANLLVKFAYSSDLAVLENLLQGKADVNMATGKAKQTTALLVAAGQGQVCRSSPKVTLAAFSTSSHIVAYLPTRLHSAESQPWLTA